MAALNGPMRTHASSSSSSNASLTSRIVLLLTALPLALAAFAFVLQWRGEINDSSSAWPSNRQTFPGIDNSPLGSSAVSTFSTVSRSPSYSTSDCVEILGRHSSGSLTYHQGWNYDSDPNLRPRICVTTSTSAGLEQILPWLYYHKVIGVSKFFLFVEGAAAKPNVSAVLESIPGVKLIYRTADLEDKQAKSRVWNETWLSSFFFKPCNYELFVKQSLNMEMAIVMAREVGMDWIIHLDTDELLHPAGSREYSLRQLLSDVPSNVDMVIFPNYESSIERDDIKDPFGEVSMFKKNYDHLPKETYFGLYKEATRGNPNYFLTYGNGKSAARVQDHLRPNGAHRWHNYMKTPNEIKLEEAAVLHYTYAKFSDLTSRRNRCGCKPTKEDVKRCFMLEFDRTAFIIASTATNEEMQQWFREHVVWSDKQLNLKLLRKGILTRIYAPMAIIRGLRDSGVFATAIASSRSESNQKSTQSADTSSITEQTLRKDISLSDIATISNSSKATARKILDIGSNQDRAVPPLSPPGLGDLLADT